MDAKKESHQPGQGVMTLNIDSPPIVADLDDHTTRLAALKARAEVKGHHLQPLGSGFLLSRWGHVHYCVDLADIDRRLQKMGA